MSVKYMNDQTGEVDLLKTFKALKDNFPLYGTVLDGMPCDLGSWEGYYYYQCSVFKNLRSAEKP